MYMACHLLCDLGLVHTRRSVGTFARALDCSSTVRQPSLHMSAAAASRDVTLVSQGAAPREVSGDDVRGGRTLKTGWGVCRVTGQELVFLGR